ncbi:MAG: hypothetical protein NMNS02_23280 [Nitrosomonas sp.]|nr:MAG: hypothetical protein NMNS02_23280 [Nitrosomonas sp.]
MAGMMAKGKSGDADRGGNADNGCYFISDNPYDKQRAIHCETGLSDSVIFR